MSPAMVMCNSDKISPQKWGLLGYSSTLRNYIRYLSLVNGGIIGSPRMPEDFTIAAVAVRKGGWVAIVEAEALATFRREWYDDHKDEWSSVTILA